LQAGHRIPATTAFAWEQPREASRPDECFPRSAASTAGDCLGDIALVPVCDRPGGDARSPGARSASRAALDYDA
jgi:hypothetical protein